MAGRSRGHSVKRPTIIDVARAAGVSKSTVSLVLNDSDLVVPAKRTAVRKAMGELGYVYNRAAAKMRSDKVGLIGLVINDIRNPFFTEFAASVQEALTARGFATVLANTGESPQTQQMVLASMIEHGVSALIVSAAYGDPQAAGMILGSGLPTLTVLRRMEGDGDRLPFLSFDYEGGSRLAVQHLIDLGARRIAWVGGLPERSVTTERMAGGGTRFGPGERVVMALHGRPTRAFGREVAGKLLTEGIEAALCFNDIVALGVADGLEDHRRRAGRDMALIGFDDIEEAATARPPLTTVHCDIAGFGRHAAAAVLDWIEKGEAPSAEQRLPVRLVIRESTARG